MYLYFPQNNPLLGTGLKKGGDYQKLTLPIIEAKIKCSALALFLSETSVRPPTSISPQFSFKPSSHLAQVFYKTPAPQYPPSPHPWLKHTSHVPPLLSNLCHLPTQQRQLSPGFHPTPWAPAAVTSP